VAGEELAGGVLPTLASAASKYAKLSAWEVGQPIFKRPAAGDAFSAWANRCLPYGVLSNRFDDEGLPAQRVELVKDNVLQTFTASQRYADYLNVPPTGAFGNAEVPPGRMPASALLAEPYVEVETFSWFNPNTITGDFATEIRLGYRVDKGRRTPFRGGLLVGNWLEAVADMHWSAESGFFGNYLGPTTARFNKLKVAGA
jgi:predicted Zn-dependent protease